jgi:hypothetical protein
MAARCGGAGPEVSVGRQLPDASSGSWCCAIAVRSGCGWALLLSCSPCSSSGGCRRCEDSILTAAWHVLQTGEVYRDLGGDYFTRQTPDRLTRRLVRLLEAFGHHVTIEARELAARQGFRYGVEAAAELVATAAWPVHRRFTSLGTSTRPFKSERKERSAQLLSGRPGPPPRAAACGASPPRRSRRRLSMGIKPVRGWWPCPSGRFRPRPHCRPPRAGNRSASRSARVHSSGLEMAQPRAREGLAVSTRIAPVACLG